MPELPEVETVRAGLEQVLGRDAVIARIELMRADLRAPIPVAALTRRLRHQPILAIRRRAKYLIFVTPVGGLLCHLGMTGSWRLAPAGEERDHDHCYLHLQDGRRLAFRDPRRFGLLDVIVGEDHPCLRDLGPEPLEADFTADYLFARSRRRKAAIKALIMDQAVVVGVGNIYAAEALFLAGIRPQRRASSLSTAECRELVAAIRRILRAAIRAGGSTISDFRQAGGGEGYFQHRFRVYDRAGQACGRCAGTLKGALIGGRSSVWCPQCQQ